MSGGEEEKWTITATESAVGPARDRVLAHALTWGYALDDIERQMLRLLASEMITNAVLYGQDPDDVDPHVGITVSARPEGILLVVRDHSPAGPSYRDVELTDEHGRGVTIMQTLSLNYGWWPVSDGKAVYALQAATRQPRVLTLNRQRAIVLLDRIRAMRPTIRVLMSASP